MKGLFVSLPLHGHTNPSLPLVRELVARGHDVTYVSTDQFATKVTATGARYHAYRNTFVSDLTQLQQRMEMLPWLLLRTTSEVLDHDLPALRDERPDYVITDSVAPWGYWIGEALNVPAIASITTFAFNRHMLAFAGKHGVRPKSARLLLSKLRYVAKALRLGRQLRRRHGINGPGIRRFMFHNADLNIVYTSRAFQPVAETFDDRFKFIGPSMDPRQDTSVFPSSQLTHATAVYVSLGTLFNRDVTFYQKCFTAFRDADFQVVMSIGSNVPVASLGVPPANFIVCAHVPQLEVLQRVSAFITHGGMNSVSESLYNGVPVVVIPQIGEQAIIGRRVEQIGAGLYLSEEAVTPDTLRQSVAQLLADDTYRKQAAVIRESFLTAGGPARGADEIVKFTARR